MIGETKIVAVAGTVGFDLAKPRPRPAYHAGIVVHANIKAGSFVRKGDQMLSVTGPDWRRIQEIYTAYRRHQLDRETIRSYVGLGRDPEWFIDQLRLTKDQKRSLNRYKRVIDPVPIFSPFTGLVTSNLQSGDQFDRDTSLFCVAERRVADVELAPPDPDWELDEKVDVQSTCRDDPFAGSIIERRFMGEVLHLRVQVVDPENLLVNNTPATFRFTVRWVDRAQEAFKRIWPWALPLRGSEAQRLGLLPPTSVFDRPKPPSLRPKAVSPFKKSRPSRDPAPFALAAAPPLSSAAAHRFPLILTENTWRKLKISTATVQPHTIRQQWRFDGRVVENAAPLQPVQIAAPMAGECHFVPFRANDRIRAGSIIGRIKNPHLAQARATYLQALSVDDPNASKLTSAHLQSLGHTLADLNEVRRNKLPDDEFRVMATFDGVALEDAPAYPVMVDAGQDLLRFQAFNTVLISGSVARSAFADLPARVQLALRRPSDVSPIELVMQPDLLLPLVEIQVDVQRDRVAFKIPVAEGHPSLRDFDVVSAVLTDPSRQRSALAVPADCITSVAQSYEVLVHSGGGRLTPISVTVGVSTQGLTEITGPADGSHLVRDLELLKDEDSQIAAILVGFWNPTQYIDNIRADAKVAEKKVPSILDGSP